MLRARSMIYGVYNSPTKSFLGLAREWGKYIVAEEYEFDSHPRLGTARAIGFTGQIMQPYQELVAVLKDRCSECTEQLYPSDDRWVHEDGTPICGNRCSFTNKRLFEYLVRSQGDWERSMDAD